MVIPLLRLTVWKFGELQSYLVEFLVQVQAENLPYDLGRVQPALEFDSVLRIRLGQAECSTQLYEQIIKFARALIEPLNKALY